MNNFLLRAKKIANLILFIILSLFLFLLSSTHLKANTLSADTFKCEPSFKFTNLPCNKIKFELVDGPESDSGYTYTWFFGDGNFSYEKNPVHSFSSFGKFGICVNVKGEQCNVTYCDSIVLTAPKNHLRGIVFFDENKDGIYQKGEKLLPNNLIHLLPGNQVSNALPSMADTSNKYNYSFQVESGSFLIKSPSLENYNFTAPKGLNFYNITIPQDTCSTVIDNLNFGVYPDEFKMHTSIQLKALNTNRPGKNIKYQIIAENLGAGTLSGKLIFNYDPKLFYLFSSISPNSNSSATSTLTYNFTNLKPFEKYIVEVTFNNPISMLNGDSVINIASMEYNNGGQNIEKRSDTLNAFVTQKTYNNEIISEGYIRNQKNYVRVEDRLDFSIKFQNMKSTSSAKSLVITDTISPLLDLSTLEIGATSLPCVMTIEKNSILKWTFDKINLPDTLTNEESSHGFVGYSIKPKLYAKNEDIVLTNANLRFDNNANLIKTPFIIYYIKGDTVTQEVGFDKRTFPDFAIYPNPSNGDFFVKSNNKGKENLIRIVDLNGRLLHSTISYSEFTPIELSEVANGMYFLQLFQENKFIGTRKISIQ